MERRHEGVVERREKLRGNSVEILAIYRTLFLF